MTAGIQGDQAAFRSKAMSETIIDDHKRVCGDNEIEGYDNVLEIGWEIIWAGCFS